MWLQVKKMLTRILFSTLILMAVCTATATAQRRPPVRRSPVPVIFDTDMGPDYDDVGAIALLHALADSGQAQILATVASTTYPRVAAVLDVFNTYFKRPRIPIGVPKGAAVNEGDFQHWSDTLVVRYPHRITQNEQAADAVTVYRQVLARQPDHSVTIVTVGFLTNLANLLASPGDRYSPLTGRELVARKVARLVSMAGWFPNGREFNVHKDAGASQQVFGQWPTEIILSGFDIGKEIKTGLPLVQNPAIRNSPVKDVFAICLPKAEGDRHGRMSWDQTAVLVAIKGTTGYYTLKPGRMRVAADGSNTWDEQGKGHFYLVPAMPVPQVTAIIDRLMQHQPAGK